MCAGHVVAETVLPAVSANQRNYHVRVLHPQDSCNYMVAVVLRTAAPLNNTHRLDGYAQCTRRTHTR
jgi:hypothetical protein